MAAYLRSVSSILVFVCFCRCKGIVTTKEVPYFINPKEVSFVVAVLSALAFLSRAEIGEIRVVGVIPFYLPSCSVWTKVGGCGSKEARSAGTWELGKNM